MAHFAKIDGTTKIVEDIVFVDNVVTSNVYLDAVIVILKNLMK